MRHSNVKTRWRNGQAAIGTMVSLRSALAVENLGHAGFDFLLIDLQHGENALTDLVPLLQAASTTSATPLVRVPRNDPWPIGRALDMGAYGVVVPLVNTAIEARAAVDAARYPALGSRSWGAPRGLTYGGGDYFAASNDELALIVMLETQLAIANAVDILSVPGIDGAFIGPNDLSISFGHGPEHASLPADVEEAIQSVLRAARATGKSAGIQTYSGADAQRRAIEGFTFLGMSTDSRLLAAAARSELASARVAG